MVDYHDLHSVGPCQCPKCRAERGDYTSAPRYRTRTSKGGKGRYVGIVVGVIASIIAAVVVLNPSIISSLASIPPTPNTQSDDSQDFPATQEKVKQVAATDKKIVTRIEYYVEDETDVLLDQGAFLQEGDTVAFNIQVPNANVTTMEGKIAIDGSRLVHAKFTDRYGIIYCSQCEFDVYPFRPDVSIPVEAGDAIKLQITNSKDAELQAVNINLSVTYPDKKQRVVTESIDDIQPDTFTFPEITLPDLFAQAQPAPREPIKVYDSCDIYFSEYAREVISADCRGATSIFRFNNPPALKNLDFQNPLFHVISFKGKLYQYGDNDFELGIKDQVSEKRYKTTYWELPT